MAPVSSKQKGKARQRSHSAEDDDSDGMLPTVRSSKTKSGRTSKGKRVKAPTKKELLETQKATARIKADQRPTLPRRQNKLRISSLFEKLSNGLRGLPSHEPTPDNPTALHSDPIQPFSSSPARPTETFIARPSTLRPQPSRSSSSTIKPVSREFVPSGLLGDDEDEAESSSKPPRTPTKAQDDVFQSNGLLDGNGGSPAPNDMSDDEEMPSVGQILNEANREKEQTEIQRKLREAKLQYLQKQQQQAVDDEDDSDLEIVNDDMHIVAKEEDKDRRSRKAKHIGESVGRQKQLTAAGKASLIRGTLQGSQGQRPRDAHVNQKDLNQLLLHASDKQSRELTAQKEAEFAKRVGQRREEEPSVDKAGLLEMLARRSRENRAREDSSDGDDEGEGDDENDGNWMPDAENENENDMDEDGDISEGMTDLPIATDDDVGPLDAEDDDDEENEENIPMRVGRSAARPRAVFDSDDEEDGENRPATGRVLVAGSSVVLEPPADLEVPHPMLSHRSSVSSMSERLEEGTDKENDFRLMFDRGDDKENTAVASQSGSTVVSPLAALRGGSGIFSLPSLGRTASTSSVLGLNPTPAGEDRSPLQELPTGDEDDDVFLTPSTKQTLHRPSSSKSPLLSQSLSPLQFRSSGKGKGLSSLFEDDEAAGPSSTPGATAFSLEPAADIRPGGGGLSQFFAASGQADASPAPVQLGKPIGFSQFMTPIKAGSNELALTLGQSLQPALEVDENLLRQADNIFEKEQEFIVEEGARVPRSAAKPLFINRHGFLTQTKPPSSPASPAFAVAGPSVTRQPLSTIALSRMSEGEEEEEENLRPRRLRRRSSTPEKLQGYRSSPSPSPAKPRNAFDLLGHKPGRIKAPQFDKKRLMERNEFIEGEAEESDEDAGFGFGLPKKKDEEEELDGEDQDQVLEELVDDAHMDDDTLNEERVLEKVQEHRALDDAADEKIARDAAEGKMRV
ncbi:hypothetical protein BC629DRAFT_1447187 [Irpex lacteus]|nr:hypothetical protein BC629DRAFT_1447187 [Irpex lacteus]